jgi:hypothetical protein
MTIRPLQKMKIKLRSPPRRLAIVDAIILGGAFFTCASMQHKKYAHTGHLII